MDPKNENKVNKNQKNSIIVETEVITNLTGKKIPVPIWQKQNKDTKKEIS